MLQMNSEIKNKSQQGQQTKKQVHGRWTKSQHDKFMKALQKYGRNWVDVQKFVKTRSLSQVRSHAQKIFMRMSDSDIEAMIMGEKDSDFQDVAEEIETVDCYKSRGTRTSLKRNKGNLKELSSGKGNQQRTKEDLLEIFKRAIQLETISIMNENQSQTLFKEEEIKAAVSDFQNPIIDQDHDNKDSEEIHSRIFQQKGNSDDYDKEKQQMLFVAPDFKGLYEQSLSLVL